MARMRSLALLAAPAESPMETRLRWLLILAGLPGPEVQTNLTDGEARFVGRADLYYPEVRLVLEYDGGNHRDRLVEDDRRQNLLVNAGYRLLRFTAADIHGRPDVVVSQVRAALGPSCAKRTPRARPKVLSAQNAPNFRGWLSSLFGVAPVQQIRRDEGHDHQARRPAQARAERIDR
jgi:Protein of unknown function (DUF559)